MESDIVQIYSYLLPVFEAALTDEAISRISRSLCMKGYASTEFNELYKAKQGKKQKITCQQLFHEISSKKELGAILQKLLSETGETKLAQIVFRCFDLESNGAIMWVVRMWEDLLNRRPDFEKAAWIFSTSIDYSSDRWLLDFAYHIACAESDSKTVSDELDFLQKLTERTSSDVSYLSSVSDLSYSASGDGEMPGASILHKPPAHQVSTVGKEKLFLLNSMLNDCLMLAEKKTMCKRLKSKGYIDESLYRKSKSASGFDMAKLVARVAQCGKPNWRDNFLKALSKCGASCAAQLHKVVSICLSNEWNSESVSWMIDNWEELRKHEMDVIQKAEYHIAHMTKELIGKSKIDWLLYIIHEASDSDKFQVFIEDVKNKCHSDSSSHSSLQESSSEEATDSDNSENAVEQVEQLVVPEDILDKTKGARNTEPTDIKPKPLEDTQDMEVDEATELGTNAFDTSPDETDGIALDTNAKHGVPDTQATSIMEETNDSPSIPELETEVDESTKLATNALVASQKETDDNSSVNHGITGFQQDSIPAIVETKETHESPTALELEMEVDASTELATNALVTSQKETDDNSSVNHGITGFDQDSIPAIVETKETHESPTALELEYELVDNEEDILDDDAYQPAKPAICPGKLHFPDDAEHTPTNDHTELKTDHLSSKDHDVKVQIAPGMEENGTKSKSDSNEMVSKENSISHDTSVDILKKRKTSSPGKFSKEKKSKGEPPQPYPRKRAITKENVTNDHTATNQSTTDNQKETELRLKQDKTHDLIKKEKTDGNYVKQSNEDISRDEKRDVGALKNESVHLSLPPSMEIKPTSAQEKFSMKKYLAERKSVVKSGKFIMEFQAKFAGKYTLPDGCHLCIYHDQSYYPMHYNQISQNYQFSQTISCSHYEIIYKYCIIYGEQIKWEVIPENGILNRRINVYNRNQSSGHVIQFDIVQTSHVDQEAYTKIYNENIWQLLPHFDSLNLQTRENENGYPMEYLIKLYIDWFRCVSDGICFLRDISFHRTYINANKFKGEPICQFIASQNSLRSHDKCKSVLGHLCLALSMQHTRLALNLQSLIVDLCVGLSIHDLSDDEMVLLRQNLQSLVNEFDRSRRQTRSSNEFGLHSINSYMEPLSITPYFMLVLPIYQLIKGAYNSNDDNMRPSLPNILTWSHLCESFRLTENERCVKQIAPKIQSLAVRFPWIVKMFQEITSLPTVVDLLNSGDYNDLFDISSLFNKLVYAWKEINRYNKYVTPDVMMIITSKLSGHLIRETATIQESGCVSEPQVSQCLEILSKIPSVVKCLKRFIWNENCLLTPIESTMLMIDTTFKQAEILLKHQISPKVTESLNSKLYAITDSILVLCEDVFNSKANEAMDANTVELWNMFSAFNWSNQILKEECLILCKQKMKECLPLKFNRNPEKLLMFYAEEFDAMKPNQTVHDVFTDVLINHVEDALAKRNFSEYFLNNTAKLLVICKRIFSNKWNSLFDNKSTHKTAEDVFLQFIGDWKPATVFYQILSTNQAKLKGSIFEKLKVIEACLNNLVQRLQTGGITATRLRHLYSTKTTFREMYNIMLQITPGSSVDNIATNLHSLIELRFMELRHFYDVRESVATFLDLADRLKHDGIIVDVKAINELCERDVNDHSLSRLVKCRKVNVLDEINMNTQPEVTYFHLSSEEIAVMQLIRESQILSNTICLRKMTNTAQGLVAQYGGKTVISVKCAIENVWHPVEQKLLETVRILNDGTITLTDLDKILDSLEKDSPHKNFHKIKHAFENVFQFHNLHAVAHDNDGDRAKDLTKRLTQIRNYLTMKLNRKCALTLKGFKTCLKLEGDFKSLEIPLCKVEKQNLNSISEVLTSTTSALRKISDDRLMVLSEFLKQKRLVEWLRHHMKNLGEVKVMSDLAMISAGETPMELDRVSCFLSAAIGFAPLLFDLPAQSGLDELLKACEAVWNNVERGLVKKWQETAKHLEWLKTVKDLHGSVEKSSLTRAQQINESGIYKIFGEAEQIPTLDNCLKLVIPKQAGKNNEQRDEIRMSLRDLRDLQSRLMLIAGEAEKGKQDVQMFVDVLSSVENLAKAYIQLKSSGCLLFNKWKAHIRCSGGSASDKLSVEVFFDETSPTITSREDLIPGTTSLTKVLHDVHTRWMNYLSQQRNQHYHLNYYNIHQLTYLCKQLAYSADIDDFADQVYTLLASVKRNPTFDELIDLLDEATRTDAVERDELITEENVDISKIQRKKKVVRQLAQLDMSENIAKAAVQSVKNMDIDECYLWALENENEDESVMKLVALFDEEVGFEARGNNVNVVQSVLNDRSTLSLEEVIERIQNDLEQTNDEDNSVGRTVKTVCERYLGGTAVTSMNNCMSIEHMGKFLSMLSESSKQASILDRILPEHLKAGQPNLMICKPADVWQIILSIYAHSPDLSLPSASEVLVCSQSTTAEEVELFLRRAIQDSGFNNQLIYCIACADQLTFNISRETERLFQMLSQQADKNAEYRLIILTSVQQHYLTSCFDEHQVDAKFPMLKTKLETYVRNHLSVADVVESASTVDADHSSVRVVYSEEAGMGKSLYVARRRSELTNQFEGNVYWHSTTIRFLEKSINIDDVVASLLESNEIVSNMEPHFVHIDITPSVQFGVHKFLFDLIILRKITDGLGRIWRHQPQHFYIIEYTIPKSKGMASYTNILGLLPSVTCLSPMQVKEHLDKKTPAQELKELVMIDTELLMSPTYQRPYQYLLKYADKEDLDEFLYLQPRPNAQEFLDTMLKFCSITDPSWLELSHFSRFLNVQLNDCEKSVFCNPELTGPSLNFDAGMSGFKKFVVRFMIRMSQDFATPSLSSNFDEEEIDENNLFELHQLRRKWETNLHPYMFFNDDRFSMSFVHFNIDAQGSLCHPVTNEVIQSAVMTNLLFRGLNKQGVDLQQNFDLLTRENKLATLCNVFGVQKVFDPDKTYELTTDNVLKMLAIHMRFRCGIPVVIMGETGCGKTRMVEFMSKLKAGDVNQERKVKNMVVVKVHGGITVAVIQDKVREAIKLAEQNSENGLETVLFLDEANTTEAIYAIKEVVCDGTVHGQSFVGTGLKIVAACNPYKRHSEEMIKKMEKSGLGFHVKTQDVTETFAGIPMRHLVYRVISLPPSMQPLVWDFGQLNAETEEIYIHQMVCKLQKDIEQSKLKSLSNNMIQIITKALVKSQAYMRKQADVCSFVSLRDVERTIQSYKWFYEQLQSLSPLIDNEKMKLNKQSKPLANELRAVVLALGMCYHATLSDRQQYRQSVSNTIQTAGGVLDDITMLHEIIACQNVFINAIELENDIARNEALRENVFMIITCAEMRIPLFLVGKPGSSKSLAKTIVADAMQGRNSRNEFFHKLKQIQVFSFQCSTVSDAAGIEMLFSQCAQLQKNQDLDRYVAVVVLDEIGLAEDSPKMPLKVLHPLLEVGSTETIGMEVPSHNKVGFVGISNWALDPAKMNRGIFVTRGDPTKDDLHATAEAIFQSDKGKIGEVNKSVKALTSAYLEIYRKQDKEFFGLRDYYSLLKMMFSLVLQNGNIMVSDIAPLVIRNFSGSSVSTWDVFEKHLSKVHEQVHRPRMSVETLIQNNLKQACDSRFLLLLTKQYSAVSLLTRVMGDLKDYQVIFGSSFPRDHDYTEVCRNINRIKVCMESGRAVVLLNLRDLYESLYDALNQHYVTFADQRYVDLGLGGHRVKCRIAKKFRLVVIEEQDIVYNEFPIPLINRLEKHVFDMQSILSDPQINLFNRLKEWVGQFSKISGTNNPEKSFTEPDAFTGYHHDTVASAVLATEAMGDQDETTLFHNVQRTLLQSASMDAMFRLPKSNLSKRCAALFDIYSEEQQHDSLSMLLAREMEKNKLGEIHVFEISSYSQILNEQDRLKLEDQLDLPKNRIMLLTLEQFQSEREYSGRIDEFFNFAFRSEAANTSSAFVLLIQCPQVQQHSNLIACAKYCAMNKVKEAKAQLENRNSSVIIAFLFTLERQTGITGTNKSYTSFHSQECDTVYVDELRPGRNYIACASKFRNLSVLNVLQGSLELGVQDMNQSISMQNSPVLDIHRLIKDSIPQAVAKLQNKEISMTRNRVTILQLLKTTQTGQPFFSILSKHIIYLMEKREKSMENDDWVVQEACSPHALQEGGTFRKTLWLKLKNLVSTAIAVIIRITDGDNNLNLLSQDNKPSLNLWLETFQSPFITKGLSWPRYDKNLNLIVNSQKRFNCRFPFSGRITEELVNSWNMLKGTNDMPVAFFDKVAHSQLQPILNAAAETDTLNNVTCFISDLTHILYKVDASMEEYEAVQKCMLALFRGYRNKHGPKHNAVLEAFVLFMESKAHLKELSEVLEVQPKILQDVDRWIEDQTNQDTFVVATSAFDSLVKYLEDGAPKIDKVDFCENWKDVVSKAKHVAEAILLYKSTSPQLKESWKRIVFVQMFLEQLVPNASLPETAQKYLATLAPLARRLWTGARTIQDLSDIRFLNILTKTLQGCLQEIKLKLLCSWEKLQCRVCKKDKLVNPVKLPCRHYICQACVPLGNPEQSCPICRKKIPPNWELQPVALQPDDRKVLDHFEVACQSFFLDYLSTLCFPSTQTADEEIAEPPDEKVIYALEKLVICDNTTQTISPIRKHFDQTPTARSFILQLLLRCNRQSVLHHLDLHFQNMANIVDKKSLMDVYTQCLQDMKQTCATTNLPGQRVSPVYAADLFNECTELCIYANNFSQVMHLDLCAKLKFVSRVVVDCIYQVQSKTNVNDFKNYQDIITFVGKVCANCKNVKFLVMKQYIVKTLCRRYGMDAFNLMLENDGYRTSLVPQNLIPAQDAVGEDLYIHSDLLVLAGDVYIRSKAIFMDIAQEEDLPKFFKKIVHEIQQAPDSIFQIMLALSVWTSCGSLAKELRKQTYGYITAKLQTHLAGKVNQFFFGSLAEQGMDEYYTEEHTPQIQSKIFQLVSLIGASLLSHKVGILTNLAEIINNPETIATVFLPTMPASNFFEVKNVMMLERSHNTSPKAYQCPNGHVYFIGECTNPVQAGKCPECGSDIGGQKYGLLHAGNKAGELTEESQAGYLLKDASKCTPPTPERKLTKLSVSALRICLHSCLLIASKKHDLHRVLKVESQAAVNSFLLRHIQNDMMNLATCLGRSIDDAHILMHQIIHKFRNYKDNNQKMSLRSMAAREQWEDLFQRQFFSLAFQNADTLLNEGQAVIIQAGNFAEKPLQRLVYELNETRHFDSGIVEWNCPALWSYRIHVDMQHVRQKLEAVDEKVGGDGSILKVLLNVQHLDLLHHLCSLLRVQNMFIAKYQQKIDVGITEKITLQQFMEDDERYIEDDIDLYIASWNKVRKEVGESDTRYNTPKTFFELEMNQQSPISMCLPSKHGRGCCALLLVEYFINMQNGLLTKCRDLMSPKPSFPLIDVGLFMEKDIILIEETRDLMPIVLANSQYEYSRDDTGTKHNIAYSFGSLEKKIKEKFILRKSLIKTETIPLMVYPQDVGLENELEIVRKNTVQVPFPQRLIQDLDTNVEAARTADICEAVRTITLAISFIAKLGGESDQGLCDYVDKEMLLPREETELIPRAAQIGHVEALYERMSWHRSLRFVLNGDNPFETIRDNIFMENIQGELLQLERELANMNIPRLQMELNSLLMSGKEMTPDWRLKDVLEAYLEGKYDDVDVSWCEHLPDDVLYKHSVHVFKISVQL